MLGIIPLFSIPVGVAKIPDTDIYISLVEKESFELVSAQNGYMTTDRRLLDKPQYSPLKQAIDREIQQIAKTIWRPEGVRFSMTTSWAMRHEKGNYSHRHRHPNSILSGILYLTCNGESGAIVFHKNHDNLGTDNLQIEATDFTELNASSWDITPTPGQILAFPGNLEHSVEENKSSIIRYCIAFNYFIEGKLGGSELSIGITHD